MNILNNVPKNEQIIPIVQSMKYKSKRVLAIKTALRQRAFTQTKFSDLMTEKGIIIYSDGRKETWNIEGIFSNSEEQDKPIAIYGSDFNGMSLLEIIHLDPEQAWKSLYNSILLLQKSYKATGLSYDVFKSLLTAGPESILYSEDKKILILPSEVYIKSLASYGIKKEIEHRLIWVHPDANRQDPSHSFSFFAGTLAYSIFAKKTAFSYLDPDTDGLKLMQSIKNKFFEPLELASWSIGQDFAKVINSFLDISIVRSIDPLLSYGENYFDMLDAKKVDLPESPEFLVLKQKEADRRNKKEKKKTFFQKNKSKINFGLTIFLFVMFFVGITMKDITSKPNTLGLEPIEIVQDVYAAIESLDHEILRLYSKKGVKFDYSSFLTNLYVTSKVREAYERIDGIISPSQLFVLKKIEGRTIYGITDLKIEQTENTENVQKFHVSLYLWLPIIQNAEDKTDEELETEIPLTIYKYADIISVSFEKDRWIISHFEPKLRTEINLSSSQIMQAIYDGSALDMPWSP